MNALLTLACLFALSMFAWAGTTELRTRDGKQVFTGVEVTAFSAAEITITHSAGVARVPLSALPDAWLKIYGKPNLELERIVVEQRKRDAEKAALEASRLRAVQREQAAAQNAATESLMARAAEAMQKRQALERLEREKIAEKDMAMKRAAAEAVEQKRQAVADFLARQKSMQNALGDHLISSVLRDEYLIMLEDRSLWEVSLLERFGNWRFGWYKGDDVVLIEGKDLMYPVLMVNRDKGESVNVKRVSAP